MTRRGSRTGPLALAALLVATAPGRAEEYVPPDCGLKSLYLLLHLSGRPAGLSEIEAALPPRQEEGYSMADLRDAARACRLPLRGIRLDRGDRLPRPAIAFLDRGGVGHYVVVRPVGVTGTMVQVLEPPHAPRVLDGSGLAAGRQWTGRLLVPETTAERNRLRR